MKPLEIRILGDAEFLLDGQREYVGKDRALLASAKGKLYKPGEVLTYLALRRGEYILRETLEEQFFEDTVRKGNAKKNAEVCLSNLRTAVGPERMPQDAGNALRDAMNRESLVVDLFQFEKAIKDARAASDDKSVALEHYRKALGLHRGPLLKGCVCGWAEAERAFAQKSFLEAVDAHYEDAVGRGETNEAVDYRRRARQDYPHEERVAEQFIKALHQAGRPEAAYEELRAYEKQRKRAHLPESNRIATVRGHLEAVLRSAHEPTPVGPVVQLSPRPLPNSLTHLIGREEDVDEIVTRLRLHRLATLIGPPGVGKSRLAEAVATSAQMKHEFSGKIAWVDLTDMENADQLPKRVLNQMGLRQGSAKSVQEIRERLVQALRHQYALLVIDNCEHWVSACAKLGAELLENCPHLHMLITSRRVLGAPGESRYRVEPLAAAPAVALFVERARAADRTFDFNQTTRPLVEELTSLLDGLPLVIELVAARAGSLADKVKELRQPSPGDSLTPKRGVRNPRQDHHKTLTDALGWSYGRLGNPEQRFFERLSVFASRWTRDAAVYICGTDPGSSAAGLLNELVEHSLVVLDRDGYYRLLEPIRQYAREQWDTRAKENSADRAATETRHLDYYSELVGRERMVLRTRQQKEGVAALEAVLADLCRALACESAPLERRIELVGRLWEFLDLRGASDEVQKTIDHLMKQDDSVIPNAIRARALLTWGTIASHKCSANVALQRWRKALPLARASENPQLVVDVLNTLGGWEGEYGRTDRALSFATESRQLAHQPGYTLGEADALSMEAWALYREGGRTAEVLEAARKAARLYWKTGDPPGIADAFNLQGLSEIELGKYDHAERHLGQATQWYRDYDNLEGASAALWNLGHLHHRQAAQQKEGTPQRDAEERKAYTHYWQSLEGDLTFGDWHGDAYTFEGFAYLASHRGREILAAKLYGAACALRETQEEPLPDAEKDWDDWGMAPARSALGDDFDTCQMDGAQTDASALLEEVRADLGPMLDDPPVGAAASADESEGESPRAGV